MGTETILEYSNRVIDSGSADGPVNRVTNELSELADGLAIVESFSHSVLFRTGEGLVAFDTSGVFTSKAVVESYRRWSVDPLHTIVYTHGHADHVGGSGDFVEDNRSRGHRDPRVIGHEALEPRLERYRLTNGWNQIINSRQFGGLPPDPADAASRSFIPASVARPTESYRDSMVTEVGGLRIELHHDRGETDDHTWAWIPERKTLCVGDLLIWVFPNAGNPQKVQRFPGEWAQALRRMQGMGAELLVPAHGLPIAGAERIDLVLGEMAGVLEFLVSEVLERMNAGWTLNQIVSDVQVDPQMLARPWLTPTYDEPEFVVRNIWRQFGGWWDANPAHLKPSPQHALGAEVVRLAGGVGAVLDRAQQLVAEGDHRLACELVEFATDAEPRSVAAHAIRAEVYQARRRAESSLMAKGIFSAASAESKAVVDSATENG